MARYQQGGAMVAAVAWLGACASAPAEPETPTVPVPEAESPVASPVTQDAAPCPLRGQQRLWAGDALYIDSTSSTRIVEFTGNVVDLELHSLPKRGERPAATVRTAGLALRGYLTPYVVATFARRDFPLLGESVVVAAGTPVTAIGASFGALDLEVEYTDFAVHVAGISCDLALEAPDGPEPARAGGRPVHVRGAELALYERPGGEQSMRLSVARSLPTLYEIEERGDWARILYDHGPRIDAWVPRDALEAGAGPDCDHCFARGFGDGIDRCPDGVEADDDSGCVEWTTPPPRIEISGALPIRLQPSDDAPQVGVAEPGAVLVVLERRGAWVRVFAPGWAVILPSGGGIWLRAP